MKVSARNTIQCTVKSVEEGAVNAEITLALPCGQEIVSIITKHSLERLALKPGMNVYAVVKSSDVMIGVD